MKLTREAAKTYVIQNPAVYFKKAKKSGYICPLCGNGTDADGDGLHLDPKSKTKSHFKCFKCDAYGDVIDFIGLEKGLTGYALFEEAFKLYGLDVEKWQPPVNSNSKVTNKSKLLDSKTTGTLSVEPVDYSVFFFQAKQTINKTSYLRGLSAETLARFNLGYVENWKHPKRAWLGEAEPATPRLIIPTSNFSYLARATRAFTEEELKKQPRLSSKEKVGPVTVFNLCALWEAQKPIFVVEGEIDALSIIDVGGEAIALGSTANKKILVSFLKKQKSLQPLILALDNDASGEKALTSLSAELQQLKIPFYIFNIAGKYKDANDFLVNEREAFAHAVKQLEREVIKKFSFLKLQEKPLEPSIQILPNQKHLKHNLVFYLKTFWDEILESKNLMPLSTGHSALDSFLGDGLYAGLYILGAVSSLGKTTFVMQIADFLAKSGQEVLIFSLEMSKSELIAKSISKETFLYCEKNCITDYKNAYEASTSREILAGYKHKDFSEQKNKVIEEAGRIYEEYASKLWIVEEKENEKIDITRIEDTVKDIFSFLGKYPVVIIDYLQILAPAGKRLLTDKQNMDRTVKKLKALSKNLRIPIIAISSLNRDSYNASVSMASFKESGSIEYSSDVLLGLQYKGIGGANFDIEKAEAACERNLELKILKNRHGEKATINFKFFAKYSYFKEQNESNNNVFKKY